MAAPGESVELPKELLEKYPSLQELLEGGENAEESHDGREAKLLDFVFKHPELEQIRNNPRKLCEVIDGFAAKDKFLINIGSDKGAKVEELIGQEKPRVFVELGGYVGYSAISFANKIRESLPEGAKFQLWSLEFDPLCAAIAMSLIDLSGLSDSVKVVIGTAENSLKRLKAAGRLDHIDMLFLDHVEELYHVDLKLCEDLGLLKPGACVVADNVLRPGAPKYREYTTAHKGLDTRVIKGLIVPGEFEDEVWVSKVK